MLKAPPDDSLSIGICSGRLRDVPKNVAEEASRLSQSTSKVTAAPGVALDGSTVADAPGELAAAVTVADAGPAAAARKALAPRMAGPASPALSQSEAVKRPIRRMCVPPLRPDSSTASAPGRRRGGRKTNDYPQCTARIPSALPGYPVPWRANERCGGRLWEDRHHAALADRGGVTWLRPGRD